MSLEKNLDLLNPNPRKGHAVHVKKPYCVKNLRAQGKHVKVSKKIKQDNSVPIRIIKQEKTLNIEQKYQVQVPVRISQKEKILEREEKIPVLVPVENKTRKKSLEEGHTEFVEKLEKLKAKKKKRREEVEETTKQPVSEPATKEKPEKDKIPTKEPEVKKTDKTPKPSAKTPEPRNFPAPIAGLTPTHSNAEFAFNQAITESQNRTNQTRNNSNEKLFSLQKNALREEIGEIYSGLRSINYVPTENFEHVQENASLVSKTYQPKTIKKIKKLKKLKKKTKRKTNIKRIATACLLAFILPMVVYWGISPNMPDEFMGYKIKIEEAEKGVLGASEEKIFDSEWEEDSYKTWSKNYKEEVDPKEDNDGDGLTNLEEFFLGTDPTNQHTCSEENTDPENLFELINPQTCEEIDFENQEEVDKFNKVISLPDVQEKFYEQMSGEEFSPTDTDSLYEVFDVVNLGDIDLNQNDEVKDSLTVAQKQQEYLRLIQKIDDYITKYRSYSPYDRDYETPVSPAIYLEVSLKYNTPLKYVLTIARLESRFGTDRFTSEGVPTRIHQHQNIYSMGLDDSGNNWTFPTWEESVESFGKWYTKFEERGVSDCSKWRIYNPNGDYCSKVESVAADIEAYLYD